MAANGNAIPCPGYSAAGASRIEWYGDLFGNANYQQHGYNISAQTYGMQGIEYFESTGYSNSGNYFISPIWGNNASSAEMQANTPSTLQIRAYYQANSVEVANNTNLAAECFRVYVRGV